MRTFGTGATRDSDKDKLDFDGFLSSEAILAFSEYMHQHRIQPDGNLRDADNWKKGIPIDSYMKSMWRHFFDVWTRYHKLVDAAQAGQPATTASTAPLQEALCALFFNVQGMLHVIRKDAEKESRSTEA